MSKAAKSKKARFFPPSAILRQKMGMGGFDPQAVEQAEEVIRRNDFDFGPAAESIFARLDEAVAMAERDPEAGNALALIAGPVMELKANGGMFGFPLASEIASVALDFLENIPALEKDALEIVRLHQVSLRAIMANGIKGQGGREGQALARELYAACRRYYKKYGVEI